MGKRKHEEPTVQSTPSSKSVDSKRHKQVAGSNEEFKRVAVRINVTLPPCHAGDPQQGICQLLNRFLLRYTREVDGVVLAYSNVQFMQRNARIMYDSPFAHFWISATLLVWRPVLGMTLTGVVNLQSRDHIGLLLHGTFNASIPSDLIPKDRYRWRDRPKQLQVSEDPMANEDSATSQGHWESRDTQQPLATDGDNSKLKFSVAEVVTANNVLTIVGTLLDRIDEVEADAQANASVMPHTPQLATKVDTASETEEVLSELSKAKKEKKKKQKKQKKQKQTTEDA